MDKKSKEQLKQNFLEAVNLTTRTDLLMFGLFTGQLNQDQFLEGLRSKKKLTDDSWLRRSVGLKKRLKS